MYHYDRVPVTYPYNNACRKGRLMYQRQMVKRKTDACECPRHKFSNKPASDGNEQWDCTSSTSSHGGNLPFSRDDYAYQRLDSWLSIERVIWTIRCLRIVRWRGKTKRGWSKYLYCRTQYRLFWTIRSIRTSFTYWLMWRFKIIQWQNRKRNSKVCYVRFVWKITIRIIIFYVSKMLWFISKILYRFAGQVNVSF